MYPPKVSVSETSFQKYNSSSNIFTVLNFIEGIFIKQNFQRIYICDFKILQGCTCVCERPLN